MLQKSSFYFSSSSQSSDETGRNRMAVKYIRRSAYVWRQTRKWHSGGRRFDPVRFHQSDQELTKLRTAFGPLFFAFDSNSDSNRKPFRRFQPAPQELKRETREEVAIGDARSPFASTIAFPRQNAADNARPESLASRFQCLGKRP